MKNKLDFKSAFFQWGCLGFYNCYAAVYWHLQGMNADISCGAKNGKGCDNCGNCSESLNCLFETIGGQWTSRQSWSGEKTNLQKEIDNILGNQSNASDKLVDFIVGFTGFDYRKSNENFKENIVSSIDANRPVIAKLKEDTLPTDLAKGYRIIIGYNEDALIEPDYKPAADLKDAVTYDEIECLYIFGEKIPQKYTFLDLLKVIEHAMDSDFTEGIWFDFLHKFDFEGEQLWEVDDEEMKNRFTRLRNVAGWIPNQGHGLQTALGDRNLLTMLGVECNRFSELLETIGWQTHLIHNKGYMIGAICDSAIALNRNDGLISAVWEILDSIRNCDLQILLAIKKAIRKGV